MYKRKTKDEYEIRGYYGYGWECVTTEETRKEAIARLKEYRKNEPGTAFTYIKKRVKIIEAALCDYAEASIGKRR